MPIPEPELPKDEAIPSIVGEMPESTEAPEAEPYVISFKNYNETECEINSGAMDYYSLDALKTIKTVGVQVPSTGPAGSIFGVANERVHNANEYSRLFKGLTDPEIDMREVKLEGKIQTKNYRSWSMKPKTKRISDGRIFFFPIGNTLYIVAIRATHYETTKR